MKTEQDIVNEFIAVFAQQGVVFTDDEIEIIFTRYATKLHNVIEHIDKGETKWYCNTSKTQT